MLSKEDRVLIKMLRVEKGYGAKRSLMAEFPRRNWSLDAVNILTVLTDINCDRNSLLVGNVI